ncbi:hypothetical protein [Streptacidiphilus sp. PAMC 29251]
MTDLLDEDEWTEATEANIPRVDLVGKAANGVPGFLLMKQDSTGLLAPDTIRNLLAKSEPEPNQEVVTMTGSPAAIAKMIHQAGRPAATAPTEPVAKDMDLDDSPDGMDVTMPMAEPDMDAPGSPMDPGSPAWEAVDAATARKWTSILARAKVAVDMLADREMLEAAAGDEDDMGNAFDLQDACCAIDYAISILAPFAVDEQSEADCGELLESVGKALAGFDPAHLDTVESLGQVRKAGRVLSAGNEAAIRGAVDSLQKVLASLPAAPTTDDSGLPVAKTANEEPDMPTPTPSEEATAASGQEPAMGTQPPDPKPVAGQPVTEMAKADGDKPEMVAVFNANGKLVGIVDPEKITMVSGASADDEAPADEPVAAPAPDASDLTPAPAAEVGTPADAVPDDDTVTKQTNTDDVLKSIATDAATTALATYSATQEQVIAKQAADLAQLAERYEELTGMVKALEEQPAAPKVFTNGAVPRDLRGMDRGGLSADVTKAMQRRQSLYQTTDAGEQNRIAADMQSPSLTVSTETSGSSGLVWMGETGDSRHGFQYHHLTHSPRARPGPAAEAAHVHGGIQAADRR